MATSREQRFSTAIILATLALCAFFLAQGTTRVLAARLLDKNEADAARTRSRIPTASPEFMRRRDAGIILRRNIFDSARGDLTLEPVATTGTPGVTTDGDWDPTQEAPTCNGTLRLVGTVVSPKTPDWSFAAISESTGTSRETLLYRKGSSVTGWPILAVRASSVVVQSGTGVCELSMFSEEEQPDRPTLPAPARAEKPKRVNDRSAGLTPEELGDGIEKISDTKYNIQRSLVDKVLSNQGSLMKTARVIPHEENGRVVGMKLYGIRRTSLLGKLGIRNGDMLRTINGFDMTSPDTALEAYTSLRSADALSLAVKRQNKEMSIEYNIQ
ncbi:MAG: type II secretion system protein GspC [Polyangiales bacterium]